MRKKKTIIRSSIENLPGNDENVTLKNLTHSKLGFD